MMATTMNRPNTIYASTSLSPSSGSAVGLAPGASVTSVTGNRGSSVGSADGSTEDCGSGVLSTGATVVGTL